MIDFNDNIRRRYSPLDRDKLSMLDDIAEHLHELPAIGDELHRVADALERMTGSPADTDGEKKPPIVNEYPHRYTVSVIGPKWSYSGELAGFDNLELAELFRDTMTEKQPLNDGGRYAVTDWQSESKDADAPSDESETNPTAAAPWYIEDGRGQVICTGLDAKDADAMNEFIREHDSEYMVVYNTTDGLPF